MTSRLIRLHLLGLDACIIWARMPASTLHKSAQQGAPEAYIFLCKSTTQDTRAQQMPASTFSGARPRRCPCRPPCERPKDARATTYARGKIHAPPPGRAYRDARATSYARL